MPSNISQNTKIDKSFKFISGVGYTTTSKSLFEETASTGFITRSNSIFIQDSGVPTPAPGVTSGVVVFHSDFAMMADTTVAAGQSWLSGLQNWIPPSFHLTYTVRIWIVNNVGAHLQEIFFTDSTGPLFDYKSGILTFDSNPLLLQAGAVGIHITGYTYSGVTLDTIFDSNGHIRIPFTDNLTNPGTASAVFSGTNGFTVTPPTGATNTLTLNATSIQTAENINLTLGARGIFVSSDTTSTYTAFESGGSDSGTAIKLAREGSAVFGFNVGVTPLTFPATGKIRLGNATGSFASQVEINNSGSTLNLISNAGQVNINPATTSYVLLTTNTTATSFRTQSPGGNYNILYGDGSFSNNGGISTTAIVATSLNAGSGTITTSGTVHGGAVTSAGSITSGSYISSGTGIATGGHVPSGNKVESWDDINCWSGQIFCQSGAIIANAGNIQATSGSISAGNQITAAAAVRANNGVIRMAGEQTTLPTNAFHYGMHVTVSSGIFFTGNNHYVGWGLGLNPSTANQYVDVTAPFSARCNNYTAAFVDITRDLAPGNRNVDPYWPGGSFGNEMGIEIEFHQSASGFGILGYAFVY